MLNRLVQNYSSDEGYINAEQPAAAHNDSARRELTANADPKNQRRR